MTPADRHPIAPPPGPWVMVQRWHELLFAHWRCAMSDLRPLVPPPLEIETFDGTPSTPFLKCGVNVRIEITDSAGSSLFGAIEQTVTRYEPRR